MSSFGSSAINKSGKKPVPKAARRRQGGGGIDLIESQSQSQPTTPALSAASVASSEEAPTQLRSLTPVDESVRLADESLITHAANLTSQTARDAAEVQLQHRAAGLAEEREQDGAQGLRGSDSGTIQDGRQGASRQTLDASQLEQPHIQQRLIDETNRLGGRALSSDRTRHAGQAGNESHGTPIDAGSTQLTTGDGAAAMSRDASQEAIANKRKRTNEPDQHTNKRARHLQTSGEATLESLNNEVQESIEDSEAAQPTKKPRKVRKDKGIPRTKKLDQSQGGEGNVTAPAVPTSTRELRRRPTTAPQDLLNSKTAESTGDEGEEEDQVQRRKRRKRKATPDGNEDIQIDPSQAQMLDMLVPSKTGKLSTIEKRMREIDWEEVKRKRKAARNPPAEDEGQQSQQHAQSQDNGDGDEQATAGATQDDEEEDEMNTAAGTTRQRTRIVNGIVTVVDEALQVDRHAEGDAELDTLEVVEHEDLTERITSISWIDANRRDPVERKCGRKKSDPWNLNDTDKFYEALSMFGTDFFVIAKMFKGKTRRQVKMKFVREEHDDPDRVKRTLHSERKLLDLEAFKLATGITNFKSPEEIHRELEEDKREREEEIVRAREEYEEMERQRKVLEAGGGENVESAKENDVPGAKGKKKAKSKSKKAKEPVTTLGQAEQVVEVVED